MKLKNTIVKILIASMAVSVLAFAGSGCNNKNDTSNSNSSSAASSASESSADESKTRADNSDTDKSDTDKNESSAETEKSEIVSSDESKTETSEESTESAPEESIDETPTAADTMTVEMMIGTWEYNVGSAFMGLQLLDNGTAFISAGEIEKTMIGSWDVEDNRLKLTYWGESTYYVLNDGVLFSVESPSQFFTKKSDSTDAEVSEETPSETDTMTVEMMIGTWEYNVGSAFMGLQLLDNGTALISAGEIEKTMVGTWAVEDNKLKLTYLGESTYYVLKEGVLFNVDHPSQFFTKK